MILRQVSLIIVLMLASLGGTRAQEAIQLDQLKEAPGPNYFPLTEDGTLWPITGIQVYQKFKDHHFIDSIYFMAPDSFCISLNGDSIPPVCAYLPMGGGTMLDSTYYFVILVNGSEPDTIISGEPVNFVESGVLEISKSGGTDIVFHVPNQLDTCRHSLVQVSDSTAALLDCLGDTMGIVQFSASVEGSLSDTCLQHLYALPDSSNRLILTDCEGHPMDTVEFFGSVMGSDTYADSASVWHNDTIQVYRVDTSGAVIDSFPLVIPVDSIDTYAYRGTFAGDTLTIFRQRAGVEIDSFKIEILIDSDTDIDSMKLIGNVLHLWEDDTELTVDLSQFMDDEPQSFSIDTTTALFTLSDDPSASPDLLVLPWRDAIRNDYSANYTDSIRHNGYTGINIVPVHPLDVTGTDPFNVVQGRFRNSQTGVASIRLERSNDGIMYDFMNWGSSFDIRRFLGGSSTAQLMRLDTATHDRPHHYIWHDDEGFLWATDYGSGFHTPGADGTNDWQYILAPRSDGKFYEVPLIDLFDSIAPIINLTHIDQAIDSIQLDSFPNLRERRSPYHIAYFREDSLISDKTPWGHLFLMNDADRWIYLDDTLGLTSVGKQASVNNLYNSALGAFATVIADTITQTISSSQVDTANNVFTGLSSYITHLGELGYNIGDVVGFTITLNSGEMPWIDTSAWIYLQTGLITLRIASSSTLAPTFGIEFDSAAVGSYDLTANQFVTYSTAIGAFSKLDRNHQVALGDSTLMEVKIGDSIRIKADTSYMHHQVMGFDTAFNQIIPLDMGSMLGYDFAHGSVIWWDTTGGNERFQEDSLMFFWSKDSARLAIGHKIPATRLHVQENTNLRPTIATFENTSFGHAFIKLKTQNTEWSLQNWNTADIFRISGPGLVAFEADANASSGMTLNANNSWTWPAYGSGDFQYPEPVGQSSSPILPVSYLAGWDAAGNIRELSFDSLNALLDVAVSTPDITYHELRGDTLGLNLNASVDTAWADLSKYVISIVGDSIFQGGEGMILPAGADSVGTSGTATEVLYRSGGKGATSNANFTVPSTTSVRMPQVVNTGYGSSTHDNILELGIGRTGTGNAYIDMHAESSVDFSSRIIRLAGTDGSLNFAQTGTGGIIFRNIGAGAIEFETSLVDRLVISAAGNINFGNYTSTGAVTGTSIGLIGFDASGNLLTETFDNIEADMGGPFDNFGSFSIAANTGMTNGIFSGETLTVAGSGISSSNVVGNTVTVNTTIPTGHVTGTMIANLTIANGNIANNAITTGKIADGTIVEADLNITNLPNDKNGWFLSFNEAGGNFTWVDPSLIGIQSLGTGTRTINAYPITISGGGSGVTLGLFTSDLAGMVRGSGGGTSNFLRADGTWAAPPGGGGGVIQNLGHGTQTATTWPITISDGGTGITLGLFSSTTAGLVRGSGGGSTNFLRADGTWQPPPSGSADQLGTAFTTGEIIIGNGATSGTSSSSLRYTSNILRVGGTHSGLTSPTQNPMATITANANNIQNLQMSNTSSGAQAEFRSTVKANNDTYIAMTAPSSGNTTTYFGMNGSAGHFLLNTTRTLGVGTLSNANLVLGTNNAARMTITGAGAFTLAGTTLGATYSGNSVITSTSGAVALNATNGGAQLSAGTGASVIGGTSVNLISNGAINITAATAAAAVNFTGKLSVNIASNTTHDIRIASNDAAKGTAGSWVATSDERLKDNINQIDSEKAIDLLLGLRGVNYEWTDQSKTMGFQRREGKQWGLIAQDIVKVFGEDEHFVSKDDDGYYMAAYGNYDPLIIESIRYLKDQNEQQQAQISVLTEQINKLYDLINKK